MNIPFVGPSYQARRSDVLPGLAVEDHGDKRLPNSELFSKGGLQPKVMRTRADIQNISLCQLRVAIRGARKDGNAVASLGSHISEVLSVRPKKQVARINAKSIVAAMADEHFTWVAMVDTPAKSRSCDPFAIRAKRAVSAGTNAGGPVPALVRSAHRNFCPKTLNIFIVGHALNYRGSARKVQQRGIGK